MAFAMKDILLDERIGLRGQVDFQAILDAELSPAQRTSSVPIFLSSARFTSRTSEGAFTQQLQPPLAILDAATKVRTYIESASVPFSMPNLDASTARVVVLGSSFGHDGPGRR